MYIQVFGKEEVAHVPETEAPESHVCSTNCKNVRDTSNDIT